MLGYLNIAGLDLAKLINFKYAKLKWKPNINKNYPCQQCNPWSKK